MTWNVWWRFGPWRQRQHAIVATLAQQRPDIVALQEVWITATSSQARVIGHALGLHQVHAPCHVPMPPLDRNGHRKDSPDGVGIGVAVLSRWPVRSVRRFPLPSDRPKPPSAVVVTVDHPRGPLHVATTVLDWEPSQGQRRHAQTTTLATLLSHRNLDGPLPVILAGDLNARPGTPEIRMLASAMRDLWVAGNGTGDGSTVSSRNPFVTPGNVLADSRIDYLFARPGQPGAALPAAVARLAGTTPVGGVTPSDHHAVVADLRV